MPQQKSRSRKRHQFWCHRRKSAPIWSLVLSTTDKIRQFWAENKLFSRKAHKNRFFVLYPLRDKINIFIYPAIFGVSRWLPFEGENKEIYQSGLVFAFPDAYQMGEKFSKSFIKIEFSCSIPWKEKIIRKNFIFFALPCSTPWGNLSEISEAIHKIQVFVLYHLREKNFYGKGAVFDHPRCLPIEGRKYFFKRLNFRFFSWSTPWGMKIAIQA